MANSSDRDRIIELEQRVSSLEVRFGELVQGVILVEKRPPGPAAKVRPKKPVKNKALSDKKKLYWAQKRVESAKAAT